MGYIVPYSTLHLVWYTRPGQRVREVVCRCSIDVSGSLLCCSSDRSSLPYPSCPQSTTYLPTYLHTLSFLTIASHLLSLQIHLGCLCIPLSLYIHSICNPSGRRLPAFHVLLRFPAHAVGLTEEFEEKVLRALLSMLTRNITILIP